MDEFMKKLLEKVMEEEKVQVDDESKKEAAEIANLNRILYNAHIEVGFTAEESLALVVASLTVAQNN